MLDLDSESNSGNLSRWLSRRSLFSNRAWEEYLYWQATDTRQLRRINQLIKEIMREPFAGVGKTEPLRLLSAALAMSDDQAENAGRPTIGSYRMNWSR